MQEPADPILVEHREQLVALLNQRLADGIDLMLQAKLAHWNVDGPEFYALHGLFDRVYEDLAEHVDILAERAVQLGGTAEGSIQNVSERSRCVPYPLGRAHGAAHLAALDEALQIYADHLRGSADEARELADPDTADLLGGVNRDLEKHRLFLQAHRGGAEQRGA
jgi:starvation-inducible DNA-binding protein